MSAHAAGMGCVCMDYGEAELARRARLGDTRAYAELMRRHRRSAFHIAYAILGSMDDAEDAVQETFVRAYQSIERYDARAPFGAWVRRIGTNCAINRLRQRDRLRRSDREPLPLGNPGEERSPADCAEAGELAAEVRRAVDLLPLKQRLAVTLFHLEGMSLHEAAETVGCSVGAMKSHLHRARETLAKRLGRLRTEDRGPRTED